MESITSENIGEYMGWPLVYVFAIACFFVAIIIHVEKTKRSDLTMVPISTLDRDMITEVMEDLGYRLVRNLTFDMEFSRVESDEIIMVGFRDGDKGRLNIMGRNPLVSKICVAFIERQYVKRVSKPF